MNRKYVYNRTYRGPLQAIILDWAGTTMDYGCFAPAVVFLEVFKREGVEISVDEARAPMGAHKRVHIDAITKIDSVRERWKEKHGRYPTDEDVDRMFENFIPLQLACLKDYSELIPGALESVDNFRKRGLKIGSTTGYTKEMMEILFSEAKRQGYSPDSTVCASEVQAGRPHPWMCLQNAINLGVYPVEAMVKVGDTLPDIKEGLNAGMWTIGLATTGNEMGMTEKDFNQLDEATKRFRIERAYDRMYNSGAHFVVDSIRDVPPLLDIINERLANGIRP